MSSSPSTKCRAADKSKCIDPQCPEKRYHASQMSAAISNKDTGAFLSLREQQDNKQPQPVAGFIPKPGSPSAPVAQANRPPVPSKPKKVVTGLFHYELGFPVPEEKLPKGVRKLIYTNHAMEEALADKYGTMDVPQSMDLSKMKLIEMGIENNRINKYVYRGPYDKDSSLDVIVVAIPETDPNKPWRVKTVWFNEATDTHRTLDRSKYLDPKTGEPLENEKPAASSRPAPNRGGGRGNYGGKGYVSLFPKRP